MSSSRTSSSKQNEALPTFDSIIFDDNIVISQRVRTLLKDVIIRDAVAYIKRGSTMKKWVQNQLKKPHDRIFYFEVETLRLKWNSPKKNELQSAVYLVDVIRIIPGWDSDYSKFKTKKEYGIEIQSATTLRIECKDEEEWKLWMVGLLHFYQKASNRKALGRNDAYEILLKQTGDDGHINTQTRNAELADVLLRSWNISISQFYVEYLFNKIDKDNVGVLEKEEFSKLLDELLILPALHQTFTQFAKTEVSMTIECYEKFMVEIQKEMNTSVIKNQITQLKSLTPPFYINNELTEAGFCLLLMTDSNTLMDPHYSSVHQAMDLPLSKYWVATSHNTYLTGDQLIGKSAVGQYIDVLLRGCRCVELDVWDGPTGEPILFHGFGGYSLTGKISFEGVIQACKDYGFVSSPYPVILSLETHCSTKTKKRMAQLLRDILGNSMYICGDEADLLSPDALKYKFLIKGKIPYDKDDYYEDGEEAEMLEVNYMLENESEERNLDAKKAGGRSTNGGGMIQPKEEDIPHQFERCISLPSKRFHYSDENASTKTIYTMSEGRYTKYARKNNSGIRELTRKHILRVFPSGTRLGSSNFNPMPLWLHGVQLVALNYQSFGISTILAEGRFAVNGGRNCGYVLKQQSTMQHSSSTLNDTRSEENILHKTITIQILTARNLPVSPLDNRYVSSQQRSGSTPTKTVTKDPLSPYVTVRIYGERSSQQYKTPVVYNNGFNPTWSKENARFEFNVKFPSTDLLVFTVKKNDAVRSDIIAAASMPIQCIRSGIRWVPLFDTKFRYIKTCGLLVNCSIV